MQEPVLFNKTIKENILYGKTDATDEEVYIAADKANCIDFIEGNTGDGSDQPSIDQKLKELKKSNYELVTIIESAISTDDDKVKQLVYDLLSNADAKFLSLINKDSERFINSLKTES